MLFISDMKIILLLFLFKVCINGERNNLNVTTSSFEYDSADYPSIDFSDTIGNYTISDAEYDLIGSDIRRKVKFELHLNNELEGQNKIIFELQSFGILADNPDFYLNKSTKIIIHGWRASTKSRSVRDVKTAYVKRGDCNVIAVNWSRFSSKKVYFVPKGKCDELGRYVSKLIDYLHQELGIDLNQIHIIGHSLGAHIAGYAGSYAKSGKIGRITGLDPASVGFTMANDDHRLDKNDAQFVDVIHTCSGVLGIGTPSGHVDFYPNSGRPPQIGCSGVKEFVASACSHSRSHIYFAESIDKNSIGFFAYQCKSWKSFKNELCDTKDSILMGEYVPKTARGLHYLRTNSKRPFAKGH